LDEHRAFTVRYPGLVLEIVTDAMVALPVIIPNTLSAPLKILAVWDTGATCSCITETIAKRLGAKPTGKAEVSGVNDTKTVNTYLIDLYLPNNVIFGNVNVTEAKSLGANIDMLIGMDIMLAGDMAISNIDKKTTFSFRMPASKEIDFVPGTIAYNRAQDAKKRREALKKKKRKSRKRKR